MMIARVSRGHDGDTRLFDCLSRWRRRQYLLILGGVLLLSLTSGLEDKVLVHLIAREDLAELGDEQTLLQVAGQLLKSLDVIRGHVAYGVAEGTLLLRLG